MFRFIKQKFTELLSVNKCGRRYNTIDDPYARVFVSNKVKNINVESI